jgi:eukaryotic-like serine/threonine-protein kinase
MPLSAGTRLGAFQVVASLGAGGMGEVYRARDLRLGRDVAIKVLPDAFSRDAQRLARFEREARLLASLDHHAIGAIHGLEEADGVRFLVLELVSGTTLARHLSRGDLTVREALILCRQVAEALENAHGKGIIHRDLKPANVQVTPEGRVKLLDFGLGKAFGDLAGLASTDSPTLSGPPTQEGAVIGTAAYMSPEQARGQPVDKRTDVWSFGCVLYETLTRKRAFPGSTVSDTLVAVLEREPDWAALPAQTSDGIRSLLRRCLQKDKNQRLHDIADARIEIEEALADAGTASDPRHRQVAPRHGRWRWLWSVPAVLAVAVAIGVLFYSRRAPTLAARDTILLADFENRTGDAVFDDALKQGLAVQLQQSPFLNVVSDQKVNDTLRLMGRQPDDRVTGATARDLCQRAGAKATLAGTISSLGSEYVIGLNALNCATGDFIAKEQVQAGRKEEVLKALGAAATHVRRKLGESLATIERYNTPLEDATTTSLAAFKSFSLGVQAWHAKGARAAIPFYERAVELDPKFALAYSHLGGQYRNIGDERLARENMTRAYELRDRVSERERLVIESGYNFFVLGDTEKGVRVAERCRQIYPRDFGVTHDLSWHYGSLGRHEEAMARATEALRLDPNTVASYLAVAFKARALNRLEEVEAAIRDARVRKLDPEGFLQDMEYSLAFLRNDSGRMQKLVEEHAPWLYGSQAITEAYHGRVREAQEFARRERLADVESTTVGRYAAWEQVWNAFQEVEFGYREQARRSVTAALVLSKDPATRREAALVLARVGDTGRAQAFAAELLKEFPQDTILKGYWVPSIQTAIDLHHNDPTAAVQHLAPAARYELAIENHFPFALLYPVYLRGQAFLAAHQGREAAAEFQKYIDHPGLVLNFHLGALARLGLARAYALQGDTAKARTSYEDFLTLWKDADPDIPIFREAKAEYAKLK